MPSAYDKGKHHIGILRQDGTTKVGLLLVEKAGTPVYSVFDDEYLANQFFNGTPGYASLPAEKELAVRQDDWRAGFGMEVYDSNNPKRYYSSRGMDLRFKGMAIAGYLPTTATKPTLPTVPSIVNANMETVTSGWTGGVQSATYAHAGSYSYRNPTGTSNGDEDQTQDLSWNTNLQNGIFTFTCWAKAPSYGTGDITCSIGIDDGVGTTFSSPLAENTDWTQLTVTRTLAVGATRLRLVLRVSITSYGSGNILGYFDDAAISMANTIGVTQSLTEFNDGLYAGFGNVLGKLNTATGAAFNTVKLTPSNITDLKPFIDDNLYIAMNTSVAMLNMNTGEIFSSLGAGVNAFQFIEPVHSASPTMWGSVNERSIRSNLTPSNALSWSGLTNVDTTYNNITDLISRSGALYIMKENRPYYLNSVGAVQDDLAPELESLKATTSGKGAIIWKNKVYIPCGNQGLLETDGTTNTFLNPSLFCTNLSAFVGRVQAVAFDEEYLFVAVDNGTVTEILAGRQETIDNTTDWVWHPIVEIAITDVETMFVSTVYQKRLWIASTSASDSLWYIPLPVGYGNILEDTNRSFATNVAFETPWLHAEFKDTKKAWPALKVTMGHTFDTDVFFQAHYKTLSNSTYAFIANYKGTANSMVQTNYLPNSPSDSFIRLKFTANTDNTSLTPLMYSYQLTGLLYPAQREIIACVVRCADELTAKDGTSIPGDSATIIATLDEARVATWPVTLYDIAGNTQTVKFLPLPSSTPRWSLVKSEKGRTMERHYNLLMQIVPTS